MFSKRMGALFLCAAMICPTLSYARAGGHFHGGSVSHLSMGHSYRPTPHAYAPHAYGYATPHYPPRVTPVAPVVVHHHYHTTSGGSSHPFLSSMAGSFAGTWLGHKLFGSSHYGNGGYAAGPGYGGNYTNNYNGNGGYAPVHHSFFGTLLKLLLLAALFYGLYRLIKWGLSFRNESEYTTTQTPVVTNDASYAEPEPQEVSFTPNWQDTDAFRQLLVQIQMDVSAGRMERVRAVVSDKLFDDLERSRNQNRSQGVENRIEQMENVQVDVLRAWRKTDGPVSEDYVAAKMTWRALDYYVRLGRRPGDADYIAAGNPQEPEYASEVWTFARDSYGGNWLVTGIEQTA